MNNTIYNTHELAVAMALLQEYIEEQKRALERLKEIEKSFFQNQ